MGSYTAVPITNEVRLRRRLDVWEGRAGPGAPVIPTFQSNRNISPNSGIGIPTRLAFREPRGINSFGSANITATVHTAGSNH